MKKHFTNIYKNKTYNFIIRLGIIVATYFFIYKQLFHQKNLHYVVSSFTELIGQTHIFIFLVWVFLLMIVNWGIESLKWQFLISKVEEVSFLKAYEAILSGISVSVFTPNRIGEWFGRVFILKKTNPWTGVFITIVGSLSQLLITIVAGVISLLFFIPIYFSSTEFYSDYWFSASIMVAFTIIAALVLIFLNITTIPAFVHRIFKKRFIHFLDYLSVLSSFSTFELLTVLLFSFLRYCIFTLQFYLLLMMFSVDIPFLHGLMIISIIFFVMTAIPTDTLTGIGVRGSASLYFIDLYYDKFALITDKVEIGVTASSISLWIINLAIPALLGTLFVFRLKFFRKKNRNV